MNYIYKICFTSKEQADNIFVHEERPEWMQSVETIVEIGTITKPATFDDEGNELTPEKVIDGWHVDILAHSLIDELKEYCLDKAPKTPAHGTGWAENDYYIVTKDSY